MQITPTLFIDEKEINESFIRASGPGGQNVNKVATAVQLRFDIAHSPSLSEEVRVRLLTLARSYLTKEGVLIITAQRYRTQDQNRQDARKRLANLILTATFSPKKRVPTKPSQASKEARLSTKAHRAHRKRSRQIEWEEE